MDHSIDQGTRQFLKTAAGVAAAGGLGLVLPAAVAAPAPAAVGVPRKGANYRPVDPPQQIDASGKIEVLEFFWYGCPHCNAFEPLLKDWAGKLPADVSFRKLHVGLAPSWVPHQQMFFALDALGKAGELNDKIFRAIHVEKKRLNTPDSMADFVASQGLDRKQFLDAFNSFGVRTKMRRATQQTAAYQLDGVPALAVNGKWFTSPAMAGGNLQVLQVVDFLVEGERKARG